MTTFAQNHIVLKVKGCKDAHILLMEANVTWGNVYEIALGIKSNTESVIR